ncbi:unnamed protein product [Orchesella dallaii]|uniref:G-protein coupled receptors family 1 profile domain-containing protein n=1 Tax=Orchesella dallaii TaxID=48710 RepID=A0ABP1RG29_9HEXA
MEHIQLHQKTCAIIDFPLNRTLCKTVSEQSPSQNESFNGSLSNAEPYEICYTCHFLSMYSFGETSGPESLGFLILKILGGFIITCGCFGAITNILNILVLRKGPCGPSLTVLLIPLAVCDFIACVSLAVVVISALIVLADIDRSYTQQSIVYYSLSTAYCSRTASIFIAVAITVERYFVVLKPLKAKLWFTVRRTKILCFVAVLLAITINAPMWFEKRWIKVEPSKRILAFEDYPYLLEYTSFGHAFYQQFCEFYFTFDFILPLPVLLIFNSLIYKGIEESNRTRRKLSECSESNGNSRKLSMSSSASSSSTSVVVSNSSGLVSSRHQNEVNAAQMFRWVVIVLLICHIFPVIFHIYVAYYQLTYRELGFACMLCININSAVNFIIYCAFGKAFRSSFVALLKDFVCKISLRY